MEENEFDLEEKVKKEPPNKAPKDIPIDIPDSDMINDHIPPVGWKKSLNPFADNTFIPPGWAKVGDTFKGPED